MPPKPCAICLKPHYGEEDICIVCRTKEQERLKGAADAMGGWMVDDEDNDLGWIEYDEDREIKDTDDPTDPEG